MTRCILKPITLPETSEEMSFSYVVYKEHRLEVSSGSGLVTWEEIKSAAGRDQDCPEPRSVVQSDRGLEVGDGNPDVR